MKGNAILFHNFIEGHKTQYIIPVYQRNYDWLIENCDQLFNDLVKVNETQMHTHFFGSIVTAPADSYGYNRLVIDGQQRITTISLLLRVTSPRLPLINMYGPLWTTRAN